MRLPGQTGGYAGVHAARSGAPIERTQRVFLASPNTFPGATLQVPLARGCRDQIRRLKQIKMLCHALSGHVEVFGQFIECSAVMRMQKVQQPAAVWVRQGLE